MLVEEMPRSFVKKNNSYSHCPLKKRPVVVMINEDVPKVIKEEIIDVGVDDIPEPENLSTKPEDLSRHAERHLSQSQPQQQQQQQLLQQHERQLKEEEKQQHHPHHHHHQQQQQQHQVSSEQLTHKQEYSSRTPSPPMMRSPSPISLKSASPSAHQHLHILHPVNFHYHNHFPTKAITPPAGIAPIHPVAKKARVEVLQHECSSSTVVTGTTTTTDTAAGTGTAAVSPSSAASLHFMVAKASLEPLNLNTPVEPSAHYSTPTWPHSAPLYPPNYFPYPAYRYHPAGPDLYSNFPMASYSHSIPEDPSSVSPPPHIALTCPTIQRPIARTYTHWASPDQCGLSPTSSLESGSLRSPPPIIPEDLSSPGSESGRSSAGSTSSGPTIVNAKIDKSPTSNTTAALSSSSSSTTSQRYKCTDCGKSYSTYSGLSKHQHFHCAAADGQSKKAFSCKSCDKIYFSLGALKMHIRTHTLPCKCTICGKAFSRPWLLQGHIRTHTGEKPFSCQHCNRAFADRSNLRAHLQTHSEVKKYSCSSCRKTFSRMSLLSKHQEGGCPGITVAIGYDHV
ncbi:PREDICTED: protein escargot-like [Polistes dominula]|uniref:Protein escargot-like n=1 Tax=Polistes dominula TaxID=743375 RepID=A0ABM1ICF9_POLDO|nr:PREDICTED: protein escargot-like [Polistes dominula]